MSNEAFVSFQRFGAANRRPCAAGSHFVTVCLLPSVRFVTRAASTVRRSGSLPVWEARP